MFKAAESPAKPVAKAAFARRERALRVALLAAQRRLAASQRFALVIVGGVEGAGKAELANLMLEWLDARGVAVHALGRRSEEEELRPRYWRFWRRLPPRGRLAVLIGSWHTEPILDRAFKRSGESRLQRELERIRRFEAMLEREGGVLVKLWLHLSKDQQDKRLRELEGDPATAWRVTKRDWKLHARYGRLRKVSERALGATDRAGARWTVIGAQDRRARDLAAAGALLAALKAALDRPAAPAPRKPALPKPKPGNALSRLDLSLKLSEDDYERRLEELQARWARLTRRAWRKHVPTVLVFEGPDAAGKGGAIRRLLRAMDARDTSVVAVAAPSDEERDRPYLWRFWRNVPARGSAAIFDRSWYGRVLVERLEGFCRPSDWKRAFGEINDFEAQLVAAGAAVVKFWLAISPEEQLRRFKDRQTTPYKQYKIGEDDWRNRAKWDGYTAAACEMIERTHAPDAPWALIEAEDKRWARVKVLETACARLEKAL